MSKIVILNRSFGGKLAEHRRKEIQPKGTSDLVDVNYNVVGLAERLDIHVKSDGLNWM